MDVKITGIEAISVCENCEAGDPEFWNTTATFAAKLQKPGDKITYEITVENAGTIDAKLNQILFTEDVESGSEAINYETSALTNELNAGQKITFTVTVEYLEEIEEVPNIKTKKFQGIIEYVQK